MRRLHRNMTYNKHLRMDYIVMVFAKTYDKTIFLKKPNQYLSGPVNLLYIYNIFLQSFTI